VALGLVQLAPLVLRLPLREGREGALLVGRLRHGGRLVVQDVQLVDGDVADVVQVLLGTVDAEVVLRGAG